MTDTFTKTEVLEMAAFYKTRIVELEAQVDRLQAGIRVTDEVCVFLVEENRKLKEKIEGEQP
jgi:hypothetical protein